MTLRYLAPCVFSLCAYLVFSGCSGGGAGGTTPVAASSPVPENPPLFYTLASPNATATTPPPAALGVQSLNLSFVGANEASPVLVYEKAYTGNFTVTPSCQPAAGAASGAVPATALFAGSTTGVGPGAVLTVTAGTTGGTCSFTVTDTNKQQSVLFVGTSLTGGTIN